MKFPSTAPCRRLRRLKIAAALALLWPLAATACGPDFPNSYLNATDTELLAAPPGNFNDEIAALLRRLPPALPPYTFRATTRAEVLQLEGDDVRLALAARGDSPDQIKKIAEAYLAARTALDEWAQNALRNQNPLGDVIDSAALSPPPKFNLPDGLPKEFSLYAAGVLAWNEHKPDEARRAWAGLLALPEAERHYRSTWAAFMLARLSAEQKFPDGDSAATTARYAQMTRALAASGFSDTLGLAAASYGWEARAALSSEDYPAAVNLYLTQYAMGDKTALVSLRDTARGMAHETAADKLLAIAHDAGARAVLDAYLVQDAPGESSPQSDFGLRWAAALEAAGAHDEPEAADLAWAAYESGAYALAARLVAIAPTDAAIAQWIRAQLALRTGNFPDGEKLLRSTLAAGGLNLSQQRLAEAELGRVCLAQDKPAAALTAWINGGHQEDAAYLAERVLKLDELRTYVDAHCPPLPASNGGATTVPTPGRPLAEAGDDFGGWGGTDMYEDMRLLLARRLARAGQNDAAETYFSGNLAPLFKTYVADVRTGYDNARPVGDRAAAFWRAAQAIREHGMDLLGTELEPDWQIWQGEYDGRDFYPDSPMLLRQESRLTGSLFAITTDELARVAANTVPTQRFHYRYRAADLAWLAASLLPNDNDETAQILNEAGGWLKRRDPAAANRFYQALVVRCGHTALGKAAAAAHWFPAEKAAAVNSPHNAGNP